MFPFLCYFQTVRLPLWIAYAVPRAALGVIQLLLERKRGTVGGYKLTAKPQRGYIISCAPFREFERLCFHPAMPPLQPSV